MIHRVAIHGAAGRMGRAIVGVLREREGAMLSAAVERADSTSLGLDAGTLAGGPPAGVPLTADLAAAVAGCDVLVDFSAPDAVVDALDACAAAARAAVVGTTGLHAAAIAAADRLAAVAPVVVAPNFSQGVTLLLHLAARAAELLGPGFDAEIVEMHHRHKVDAPSGTAMALARAVGAAKGLSEEAFVFGRSGQVGARPQAQIGVMTLRGGDVVGEHTLTLAAPGEIVALTHRATDRAIFARGAVRAAEWIVGRPAGRYDMSDVMGLAS